MTNAQLKAGIEKVREIAAIEYVDVTLKEKSRDRLNYLNDLHAVLEYMLADEKEVTREQVIEYLPNHPEELKMVESIQEKCSHEWRFRDKDEQKHCAKCGLYYSVYIGKASEGKQEVDDRAILVGEICSVLECYRLGNMGQNATIDKVLAMIDRKPKDTITINREIAQEFVFRFGHYDHWKSEPIIKELKQALSVGKEK